MPWNMEYAVITTFNGNTGNKDSTNPKRGFSDFKLAQADTLSYIVTP